MTESRTSVLVVATACLGLTGGIFALDLLTPLGIPVWLFYLAPILLWSLTPSRVGPFVQAGLCIALTIIGLFLSPVGAPFTFALINRLFGFPLLGVAAYAVSAPRAEGLASQGARDSLSRRTVASLAGAGFLLVLLATASYWTVVLYQESERFVIHTHEVLTELSRTLSSLTDAETGQRGFLLTGHDGYLEPYTRAVMEIHGHLERLKVLTQDNQLQQSRLQVLDAKVEEKLTELRETVSARQSRGLDEALRIVISDQGKAVMDEIRSLVAVMEGTEQDLLAERAQLSQVMFMALASYLSLGGLLQIGLLAATGLFVRQAQVADQLRIETDATQRRLAAIVESSNDAIIGKTLDGLVTSWNAGAERLFGYSADEMMGQPITVLFPPDRLDEEPRIIERLKRGEHIKHFETVRLRKDGRPVEVLLTHSPVRDRQGTIVGISTIARDITELKQAETAMREALATLDATVDGTFIFDPQTLRFSYVNEGAVRQVGYSREELLCMTPLDIKPEFDEPRFRAMIATLVSGAAEAHNFTTVHRRKDGVDVPVDINLQCVGAGTGGTRLIAIVRDITEHKQAEAALAASQDQIRQMQKLDALGQLAGGIAHDFNNLLTAILGYTELAGTKLAADHPSRTHLARIREAGDRASQLVQQILAFTHQQPLARTVVPLAPVVSEVLALLRATLPAHIELTSSEVAGTPPVLADTTQIHQVLMNLCTNAWHALGQEKGTITVELAPVTLTQELRAPQATLPPGFYARLSVRDTGHGMAPETVARIFDPFFTTKPVGHGTGLGLSVVHGIIKKHDGAIVVDSQPGQGTTFHLYMPAVEVATQTEEPGEEATPVPRQGRSRHLLYLDDEEMLVELVRARFESLGYRVTGCTRPTEALDLVRANPGGVDVVVTDYNMPGLSGLEVARTLSQLRADLPVVLVSGYLSPDAQTEALAAGIRQIIYKPTLLQHLGDVIARLLDAPSQGLPPLITGENPSTHRAQ